MGAVTVTADELSLRAPIRNTIYANALTYNLISEVISGDKSAAGPFTFTMGCLLKWKIAFQRRFAWRLETGSQDVSKSACLCFIYTKPLLLFAAGRRIGAAI